MNPTTYRSREQACTQPAFFSSHAAAAATCAALALDGLVGIGEDDPSADLAHLAEYFLEKGALPGRIVASR